MASPSPASETSKAATPELLAARAPWSSCEAALPRQQDVQTPLRILSYQRGTPPTTRSLDPHHPSGEHHATAQPTPTHRRLYHHAPCRGDPHRQPALYDRLPLHQR